MPAPRLRDQLCFQLYTASRLVVRAYQPVLARLGLTYPQYLVMLVLWEADDAGTDALSVGDLGERLWLDSGTLTPLLKRLEKQGFVERRRATHDERVVLVAPTDTGRALARDAEQVPVELVCAYGGNPRDLVALREGVRAFVGGLHEPITGTSPDPE
jgi:DNA-binding MarR family transcriptional regulator